MDFSNQNASFGKIRIIKNLTVISLSFLLHFTAINGLLVLQTTMNKKEGIGTVSQAIIYAAYGLTSLLLNSYIGKRLGAKNSQLVGMIMYLPYIAANFYPSWITFAPSAVLIGMGCSFIWGGQSTYFNECAVLYQEITDSSTNFASRPKVTNISDKKAEELSVIDLLQKVETNQSSQKTGENVFEIPVPKELTSDVYIVSTLPRGQVEAKSTKRKEDKGFELHTVNNVCNKNESSRSLSSINALFFGFFGLAFCSAQVWSNLISFYVLSSGGVESANKTSNCSCGAKFCNSDQECVNTTIEEVPVDIRYIYTGVCFACGVLAVLLIWLFVDPLERCKRRVTMSWNHIFATIQLMKKKEQIFTIPLTVGTGMLQAFYTGDFTMSYIACAWSTSQIGMVTVFYGVASALSSAISGLLIRQFGRKMVLVVGQIIQIVGLALLYLWIPDANQPFILYLAGGIFGFIAGVLFPQTRALYGVFFQGKEETAFSSCNLFSSIGWVLPFVYGKFLCTTVKLYILFTVTCLGLIGYLIAERNFSLRNKQTE